jgi:hypothetical protein
VPRARVVRRQSNRAANRYRTRSRYRQDLATLGCPPYHPGYFLPRPTPPKRVALPARSIRGVAAAQLVGQQFLDRRVEIVGGRNLRGRGVAGCNDLVAHFQQRFET